MHSTPEPSIILTWKKRQIDLVYVGLDMPVVPEDLDFRPTSILRGLDETGVRCLNGWRTTHAILAEVTRGSALCCPQTLAFKTTASTSAI